MLDGGTRPPLDKRQNRRRAPRLDLRRPATLINSDGAQCEAVLLDLSGTGIRLGLDDSLRVGEVVTLRIDGAETLRARICSATGPSPARHATSKCTSPGTCSRVASSRTTVGVPPTSRSVMSSKTRRRTIRAV